MEFGKRSRNHIGRKYKSNKIKAVQPELPNLNCFPVIKQADVTKVLPRYILALSRNREDGVVMEDLDEIQQDFEKLLSTCTIRQRLLKSEVEIIKSVEAKKAKKGKGKPSMKRKRIDEKMKFKDAKNLMKVIKTKHAYQNNFIVGISKIEVPKVIKPKYDLSDRFWLSVDPYCQEITKDNVLFLEELFNECSQEIDVKISEIGDHYTTEWAENGIQSEQNNGSIKPIKKNLEEKVLKQILTVYDKIECGGFTIRSNKSGLCLDKRRLLVLEQIQMEDEILLEINKFQCELTAANKHNLKELCKLHGVVTKNLQKQEVKVALDQVDRQVMNLYNKILLVKQKYTADMKAETAYEKYSLPKTNFVEFDQEASALIKQQVLLHRELTDLTDFTLIK